MGLVDDLAAICVAVEGVPGSIGMRDVDVLVKTRTSTGSRPGVGTVTSTSVSLCTYLPNIEILSPKENDEPGIVREADIKIGPISSLTNPSILNPSIGQDKVLVISGQEYEVVRLDIKKGRWYIYAKHCSR
jgi:hypothetical protein